MKIIRATRKIAHTCIDCGDRKVQKAYIMEAEVVQDCNNLILCWDCSWALIETMEDRLQQDLEDDD